MDGMPQLPNTVRFFVDPASIDAGSTTDADLIHQWQRVLRLRIGADLLLLDGAGMKVHVVLTELTPKIARWEQRTSTPASGEPTQQITLCAALIRPERFEWLLQKSVELGVSRILLDCSLTVASVHLAATRTVGSAHSDVARCVRESRRACSSRAPSPRRSPIESCLSEVVFQVSHANEKLDRAFIISASPPQRPPVGTAL